MPPGVASVPQGGGTNVAAVPPGDPIAPVAKNEQPCVPWKPRREREGAPPPKSASRPQAPHPQAPGRHPVLPGLGGRPRRGGAARARGREHLRRLRQDGPVAAEGAGELAGRLGTRKGCGLSWYLGEPDMATRSPTHAAPASPEASAASKVLRSWAAGNLRGRKGNHP